MDTLLGENNLSAYDASGNDPYNATGQSLPPLSHGCRARLR